MATGFGFPFGTTPDGSIVPDPDDDVDLRGRVIQVLFTAPGERVNQPEFGCGLFNLVFDPNNTIMAAAHGVLRRPGADPLARRRAGGGRGGRQALDETLSVEVAYVRRADLSHQAVRVQFR